MDQDDDFDILGSAAEHGGGAGRQSVFSAVGNAQEDDLFFERELFGAETDESQQRTNVYGAPPVQSLLDIATAPQHMQQQQQQQNQEQQNQRQRHQNMFIARQVGHGGGGSGSGVQSSIRLASTGRLRANVSGMQQQPQQQQQPQDRQTTRAPLPNQPHWGKDRLQDTLLPTPTLLSPPPPPPPLNQQQFIRKTVTFSDAVPLPLLGEPLAGAALPPRANTATAAEKEKPLKEKFEFMKDASTVPSAQQQEHLRDETIVARAISDHPRAHGHAPTLQQRLQAFEGPQVYQAICDVATQLQRAIDVCIDAERSNDKAEERRVNAVLRSILSEMRRSLYALVLGNLADSFFDDRSMFGASIPEKGLILPKTAVSIVLKVFYGFLGLKLLFAHSKGADYGTWALDYSQPLVPDGALACTDKPLRDMLRTEEQYAFSPVFSCDAQISAKTLHVARFVHGDNTAWRSIVDQRTNPLMYIVRRTSECYGVPASSVYLELVDMNVRNPHVWQRLVDASSNVAFETKEQMDSLKERDAAAASTSATAEETHQRIARLATLQGQGEGAASRHERNREIVSPVSGRTLFSLLSFCDQVQGGLLPWIDYACRLDATRAFSLAEIVRHLAVARRSDSFVKLSVRLTAFLLRSRSPSRSPLGSSFHMHRAVFRYLWSCETVEPVTSLTEFVTSIETDTDVLRLLHHIDSIDDPLAPFRYLSCLVRAYKRRMLPDLLEAMRRIEREEKKEREEAEKTSTLAPTVGNRMLQWLELRCALTQMQRNIVDRKIDQVFRDLRAAHETNGEAAHKLLRPYATVVERERHMIMLPLILRLRRQYRGGELEEVANADNYLGNTPMSHGAKFDNHHHPAQQRVYYMALYHVFSSNAKQSATVLHLNGPFTDLAFKSLTASVNHVLVGRAFSSGAKDLEILVIDDFSYDAPMSDDAQQFRSGVPRWVKLETYVREHDEQRFGFYNSVDDIPETLKRRSIPAKERLDDSRTDLTQFVEVRHHNVAAAAAASTTGNDSIAVGRSRAVSQHVHIGAFTHFADDCMRVLIRESETDADVLTRGDEALARQHIEQMIAERGAKYVLRNLYAGTNIADEHEREQFLAHRSRDLIAARRLVVDTQTYAVAFPPVSQTDAQNQSDLKRISEMNKAKRAADERRREANRAKRELHNAALAKERRKTQSELLARTMSVEKDTEMEGKDTNSKESVSSKKEEKAGKIATLQPSVAALPAFKKSSDDCMVKRLSTVLVKRKANDDEDGGSSNDGSKDNKGSKVKGNSFVIQKQTMPQLQLQDQEESNAKKRFKGVEKGAVAPESKKISMLRMLAAHLKQKTDT